MVQEKKNQNLRPRPPIAVVMGHVDHGKTSLLDYIRKTNVASREAGGITQAVGAYEISHGGRKVTFIDTPGHEAFAKMRSRGAEVADLAVLVVAADEGVKPQTKEAIKILNESKTPFIVAITKIDKPGADIEKVKNELTAESVLLEGYGGQTSYHAVSSKTGEGVNELLDLILFSADLENLTFDPSAPASGYILEAKNDPKRGAEAAVILKNGTIRRGSEIYTASASGKVKIMENFLGEAAESLEPSAPVLVIGFEKLPQIGESFSSEPVRKSAAAGTKKKLQASAAGTDKPSLNLILKASDAGSLEVLSAVIEAIQEEGALPRVVGKSVGNITDGDVKDAVATGAAIIGFKSKTDKAAANLAQAQEVRIITSPIVYDLVKAVEGFLSAAGKPAAAGELEVLAVFNQEKKDKQLVGGRVISGILRNKAPFEVVRKENGAESVLGGGKILSLREKKTALNQAEAGKEVGLLVNSQVAIKIGDKVSVKK